MLRMIFALTIVCLICVSTHGNEPAKKQEFKAPAPRAVEPPIVIVMPPSYPRPDTREVWQYYGVNRMGRFVPRVIVTPYGDFYSRNLDPYYWTPNHPGAVLPLVQD